MKSNKKFPPALGAIVDQALKDKSAWIGKTVQELTCEAIRKRGLSQEDTEGCVMLTVEEASEVWDSLINLVSYVESIDGGMSVLVRDGQRNIDLIRNRIKQAEVCNERT